MNSKNKALKYFEGDGTEHNPLLIKTPDDLFALVDPAIGTANYHFKQESDIDITNLIIPKNMSFTGNYDGNNKKIVYNSIKEQLLDTITDSKFKNLKITGITLSNTISKSICEHLELDNSTLCNTVNNSTILACQSNCTITEDAADTNFIHCTAETLAGYATNSNITYCKTSNVLVIRGEHISIESSEARFGISHDLTNASAKNISIEIDSNKYADLDPAPPVIANISKGHDDIKFENLYISTSGNTPNNIFLFISHSGGFDSDLTTQYKISNSYISSLKNNQTFELSYYNYNWKTYYMGEINKYGIIENLFSHDSNKFLSKTNEARNSKIPIQMISQPNFNQRFCETRLHWDFDAIWEWDDKENKPKLRNVGAASYQAQESNIQSKPAKESLLHQQLKANIWFGN